LADVSLQTGQSLLIDDAIEKKAQLTKQTSTTQMPPSTTCHSLMTQTTHALLPSENTQTQEAIKVLKTTKGDHDVIEIATKYMPSSSSQEVMEQSSTLPSENIVVDMKYQDAQKTDSVTSELNIVHAAPQSFETVLVEPDDIITEVVVDADGTKRIIVRKLRRTMVTSRETMQQRVSTLSTVLDDAPPTVQAFSEAAMRDQQVTITRTRPDGTIETTTRQIYGGKVTTGAPAEGINVEEYESEPRYTRVVTQGQIGDIGSQPVEEEEVLMEGGEYQTKTSSVHAVVQQVTRRVIKRTRRIIRKVTIVDGKETTTEEVIEEPEEIEIDEQDIPHISINVVKSEDQKTIIPKAIEIKQEGSTEPEIPIESCTPDSPMQGPFFGPFAKDMINVPRDKTKQKITETPVAQKDNAKIETLDICEKNNIILKEPTAELANSRIEADSKLILADSERTATREALSSSVWQVENVTDVRIDEDLPSKRDNKKTMLKETELRTMEEDKHESFSTEVNALTVDSQALLDAERYAVLQTPVEDVYITTTQAESVKTSLESAITDDEPAVTKATCKSDDAPIKSETLDLENGTVELGTQHDDSSTVDSAKNVNTLNIIVLKEKEQQKNKRETSKECVSFEPFKSEARKRELSEKLENESIIPSNETDIIKFSKHIEPAESIPETSLKEQQVSSELFTEEDEDNSKDEAFKPEYKPLFHKVEISLSISEKNTETEPLVSIKTQAERPDIAPYSIVKEDVNISLPVDKETTEVIHDKIIQTSAFLMEDKEAKISQQQIADKEVKSPEKNILDTASRKGKKKKRKVKSPEKSVEKKSSISVITSLAESMEIDISTDSSQQTKQPQPDIGRVIESIIESSLDSDTAAKDTECQPDNKNAGEQSIAPDDGADIDKNSNRTQRSLSLSQAEDATKQVKTSDSMTFTDNSEIPKLEEVPDESDKNATNEEKTEDIDNEESNEEEIDDEETNKAIEASEKKDRQISPEATAPVVKEKIQTAEIKKKDETEKKTNKTMEANKKKEETGVAEVKAEAILEKKDMEKGEAAIDDANTQTIVETCDVSTAVVPKTKETSPSASIQTSPEITATVVEEKIQTAEIEKKDEIEKKTDKTMEANKKKEETGAAEVKAEAIPEKKDMEKGEAALDDANMQTTVEMCNVSTAVDSKTKETSPSASVQTSPEVTATVVEEKIQTAEIEKKDEIEKKTDKMIEADKKKEETEAAEIKAEAISEKKDMEKGEAALDDANMQTTAETCDVSTAVDSKTKETSPSASVQTSSEVTATIVEEKIQSAEIEKKDKIEKKTDKTMKADKKKKETESAEVKAKAIPEEKDVKKGEAAMDDTNTQTIVETCEISTAVDAEMKETSVFASVQTSSETRASVIKEKIQMVEMEKKNDIEKEMVDKTIVEPNKKKEEQETIEVTALALEEIQADETEKIHIDTQTILEPGLDASAQTTAKETLEVKDSSVQTATSETTIMEECAMQTENILVVTIPEMENIQVQTIEADVLSTEMQTLPLETVQMMATETQTAIKTATEVEQQTTPPPLIEDIIIEDSETQTLFVEIPEYEEKDMQTSTPINTPLPDISCADTQTTMISTETMETQTTLKVEQQETEMQTESSELTKETESSIVQEATQVYEKSIQTSFDDTAPIMEMEWSMDSSGKIKSLNNSGELQTELSTRELSTKEIPQIEESVQNTPKRRNVSAQTSPTEETRLALASLRQTMQTPIDEAGSGISTGSAESADHLKVEEIVNKDAREMYKLVPIESVMLDETSKKRREEIIKTPAAPDVQVPKSMDSVKKLKDIAMEVVQDNVSKIPTNIEQKKIPVVEEMKHQLSELSAVKDGAESKSNVKESTKESASSLTSEKDDASTSDTTSLEVHVHASIELSSSKDIAPSTKSEATDTLQDMELTEDSDIEEQDDKMEMKKKPEAMEANSLSETKPAVVQPVESENTQSVQSCNVAEKDDQQSSTIKDGDDVQNFAKSLIDPELKDTISVTEKIKQHGKHRNAIEAILDVFSVPNTKVIHVQPVIDTKDNTQKATLTSTVSEIKFSLPEVRLKTSSKQGIKDKSSSHSVHTVETVDLTLMPKDIAEIRKKLKKLQTEERNVEMISDETSVIPKKKLSEDRICETKKKSSSSPADVLAKKILETEAKPQDYATQIRQITKIITDRVKNLENINESNHLSNILHMAHMEEITVENFAEKFSPDVQKKLMQLKVNVQKNDILQTEETLVSLIEMISTWLITIEYHVFLNKQSPIKPSWQENAKRFNQLTNEANNVEKSIIELNDVWRLVKQNFSEDEQEKLQACLDAFKYQIKMTKSISVGNEKHANIQFKKWDDFLKDVNTTYM